MQQQASHSAGVLVVSELIFGDGVNGADDARNGSFCAIVATLHDNKREENLSKRQQAGKLS
jgi:hypothetical protein